MKDLQSVHLKKTDSLGPSKKQEAKSQDPIKQLLKKSSKGDFSKTLTLSKLYLNMTYGFSYTNIIDMLTLLDIHNVNV